MEIKHLLNFSITKRYLGAISLIALLTTAALVILNHTLKINETTALIVNISGKQRMLSQRILSLTQQYHYALGQEDHSARTEALKTKIVDAIEEMGSANVALSSGHLKSDVVVDVSEPMKEIYYGHTNLKERVENYLHLASLVIDTQKGDEQQAAILQLIEIADPLLSDLNGAVLQYQHEGEANIEQMRMLEIGAWVVTLITLLLEVIFIFQPMANRIENLLSELTWNKQDLEHQVQIRTLALEQANSKWSHLASHDPLTGLKNRLNMEQDLEKEISHYVKNHIPYGVLMLDIDWFKKINDTYGHDAGDIVLCELAKILKDSVRSYDSVYRSGGEEFVILLSRITLEEMMLKAESIRRAVKIHTFYYNDLELKISVSMGAFHTDLVHVYDVGSVLKSVDNALYHSKSSGRDRVTKVTFNDVKHSAPPPPAKTRLEVSGNEFETITFADDDLFSLCGYTSDDMMYGGIHFKDILHKDDLDIFERLMGKDSCITTLRLIRPDDSIVIVRAEFTRTGEHSWSVEMQNAVALAQSVEDSMIVADFNAMMDATDDYIYFKDRHHVFTAGSATLVSLTNVQMREDFVGKTDYEVFPKEYADEYFKLEKVIFSGEVDVARDIQPISDNEGNEGWVDNRKYPIKNKSGEIIGLFGIARIMSSRPV